MSTFKEKTKNIWILFMIISFVSIFATAYGQSIDTEDGYCTAEAKYTAKAGSSRIVGGSEATPGDAPWMGAMVDSNEASPYEGFMCGVSLIHSRWAVTAAHCAKYMFLGIELDLEPEDIDVVLGIHDLKNDSGERIRVKRIISHPFHNFFTRDCDIALLELEEDTIYEPIPLIQRDAVLEGRDAVIMGWGVTADCLCQGSRTLQEASVPIVSNETCREKYDDEDITDNMLCAGYFEGGTDSCSGDSGGPLMVQDRDTRRLGGITSWGDGCGEPGYYGVYTRVSQFLDFIYEYIPNLSIMLPVTVSEGDGSLTVSGVLKIQEISDSDLTVRLSSESPSEIMVPDSVTIPAGSNSVTFDITVMDDELLEGTQRVAVTVSAPDGETVSRAINVEDNESAILNIRVPETAVEGDGTLREQGTLTVSEPPDRDVTVSLTSNDTSEVSVPEILIIPAGETQARFDITIRYDGEDDGPQTVLITASVPGWTSGTDSITVVHNEMDFFTEQFARNTDLAYQTLTFIPDGSENFYTACNEAATDFPTDPSGGIPLDLGDDDSEQIMLSQGAEVFLYGVGYSSFYAGSNGYITFVQGDDKAWDYLSAHFELPRISGLFTDLYPTEGCITWKQENDRVVITYQDMPEYLLFLGPSSDTSSFQIELFFNGIIRITYLEISAAYGIAGLSEGKGMPENFFKSDLSDYGPCGALLSLDIPQTADEGDGMLRGQGIISTDPAPASDLWVSLNSDDTSEAAVPEGVLIEAGRTSASFDISISDDSLLDGTRRVRVTASAPGYYDTTRTMRINDNERAELRLNIPEIALEGEVLTGQGRVTISRPADDDILISLISDDTTEVTVPETLIILSGETAAVFDITLINDGEQDNTESVLITASVPGWTSGERFIEVIHKPAKKALYFSDSVSAVRDPVGTALKNKGYVITSADNYRDFESLIETQEWELIVLMNQNEHVGNISAFLRYVNQGGKAIMTDWSANRELGAAFGVAYTENKNRESVSIEAPELAEGLTNPLPLADPGYRIWSVGMYSAAEVLAVFPNGDAAAVIANGGSTAAVSFLSSSFENKNEGILFYENLIGIISAKMLWLSIPENADEGDGLVIGKIYLSQTYEQDMGIRLSSSDVSEIRLPSEVTVPAHQRFAAFDIAISNDGLWEGTQEVAITASLAGWGIAKNFITINDNEKALLSVNLPESAQEGDGRLSGQGTVTASRKADKDITVWLTSEDTTEVTVPETVVIRAGETSAVFDITILYDGENDGTQNATVTASVPGWTSGTDSISVVHNEIDFLTEQFRGDNDLDYQSLTFIPDGSANFYTVCRETVENFFTDPAGGSPAGLKNDTDEQIRLSGGAEIFFYGTGYSSFYIGSNGCIRFGEGDSSAQESLSEHFKMPRISGVFTNLYPDEGGVTWKQLYDRVAVTYQDIPEYFLFSGPGEDTSSFQIEMFFSGVIRITYLDISSRYFIAGLSEGNGLPQRFAESNFDSYALCSSFNRLFIDLPEKVAESAGVFTGTVKLERPADHHLIVSLRSDDTSEIIVPDAVLIFEGETSANFKLELVNDGVPDGAKNVTVTAMGENCVSGSQTVRIIDEFAGTRRFTVSGRVLYNASPLCAMVLANGRHTFSCEGDGQYELEVSADENGEITLFSFCEGLAPFKQVLIPENAGTDIDINMHAASQGSIKMAITSVLSERGVINPGWVKITGEVSDKYGNPLCAMVLANGYHMFTCGENQGRYELEVPLDENGEITLFGFCEGLLPFRQVIRP